MTEVKETNVGIEVGGRGSRETTNGKTSILASFFAGLFRRDVTSNNKAEKAA